MHGIGSPSAILRITTEGGEGFVGLAQEDGRWGLCSVHAVYTRLSKPTLSDKGRAFSDQNLDAINKKVSALGPSFASDTGRSDAQKRLRKLSLKQRNYDDRGIDTDDIEQEINRLVEEIHLSTHRLTSTPALTELLLVVNEK